MRNYSTLIYLVNNFQEELNSAQDVEFGRNDERFLTEMEKAPSESSIKNILDFARSYDVIETEKAGYVEMILN